MPKYKIYADVLKIGDTYMSYGFSNSFKLTYRGKFECQNREIAEKLAFNFAKTEYFLHSIKDECPFMTFKDCMNIFPHSTTRAEELYNREVRFWTTTKVKEVKERKIKVYLHNYYTKIKNIFQHSTTS